VAGEGEFQPGDRSMKVCDAMTKDVRIMNAGETVRQAAEAMADLDIGLLPVEENGKLVGMISDRDIAVRGIAMGRGPEAKVRDVMTSEVKYCFEDQDTDEITRNMGDIQVRRLPVLNRDKRLVGIISLGDVSQAGVIAAEALSQISRPGGQHSQARSIGRA
jgi:CBS domain-containing protein